MKITSVVRSASGKRISKINLNRSVDMPFFVHWKGPEVLDLVLELPVLVTAEVLLQRVFMLIAVHEVFLHLGVGVLGNTKSPKI